MNLTSYEIQDIIERLQNGENIPEDFKHKLFPVKQREYDLVYGGKMRREDILANEDGVFPVPLQIEKIFNDQRDEWDDGWRNIIAFGDNLQFLKTLYENKDPLIRDKVKGKVKIIYIDPPFATESSFKSSSGLVAYTDKAKGSDFVEFLRRRLIIARELLAPDGSIFVHLDQKMCHQIRLIMDEIFGVHTFQNQIIWQCTSAHNDAKKKYGNIHQVIYWYGKEPQPYYDYESVKDEISTANLKEYSRIEMADGTVVPYKGNEHLVGNGNRRFRTDNATWKKGTNKEKQFTWRGATPNPNREWMYTLPEMEAALARGELFLSNEKKGAIRCLKRYLDVNTGQILQDVWTNVGRMSGGKGTYPTEKPEILLERIIKTATKEGDLVLDFFGGSGTTAAVAEKLNRRWITCDVGKLSFYTMQKRFLNIESSKSLENKNKLHNKKSKAFLTVNTGHYDLERLFNLQQQEYSDFVMKLFEAEPKKCTIGGIEIDGEKKDGYFVKLWDYWNHKDSSVDEEYLHELHSHIGRKVGRRIYIIAPASYVDFISDYYEIDRVRYYFLKVPYHIIRELHKVQFKKFRQPQSKKNVNDLEDAIGFHFIRQPEVKSELKIQNNKIQVNIKKFYSDLGEEETGKGMDNFESLAMVLIDKDFDGETFEMDVHYFAQDLLPKKKKVEKNEDDDEEAVNGGSIKENLRSANQLSIPPIPIKDCGDKIMLIYIDIYGNEFKEEFGVTKCDTGN
ncbi:site-specific DNA-methyltransferase [Neobacillus drentensis]|uniref:site-specific DNA-methyltransferase n=1 Tax=Neobacillus drentensis TaxID=220684 RepID=UPI002FFEE341